jgi:hypothetical protein
MQSVVTAIKDQVSCDLQGEAVILNFDSGVYYGLNQVGAYVWELIQQPRPVSEILFMVLDEYDVGADRCENDLIVLLKDLKGAGLIHVEG